MMRTLCCAVPRPTHLELNHMRVTEYPMVEDLILDVLVDALPAHQKLNGHLLLCLLVVV